VPKKDVTNLDALAQGFAAAVYYYNAGARVLLLKGDAVDLLAAYPQPDVNLVFADPPYFLSNDGITCHAGRMVSVNKGKWDKSQGALANHAFNLAWLSACRRVLHPDGTIFVSGTQHIIYSVGFAMQVLGMKLLNSITWVKPNPPPNLSCRYLTHSTETVVWAAKGAKSRHTFNYAAMREMNGGRQMKDIWEILPPGADEKRYGKHPTQKPERLLEMVLATAAKPGDLVLDPFNGSGTTGVVAARRGHPYIGIEIDEEYLACSVKRIEDEIRSSSESSVESREFENRVGAAIHRAQSTSDAGRRARERRSGGRDEGDLFDAELETLSGRKTRPK
jgi:site-specific DNA-methyltransferase (adenine-specific)